MQLANMGCHIEYSLAIFEDCPPQMRDIYHYAIMGFIIPRLIFVFLSFGLWPSLLSKK